MTTETKDILEVIYWVISLGVLVVNIYVISHAPKDAVKIGRKLNDEQQKDNAKRELFLDLFAYRGSPIHKTFVDALNEIDLVFHDTPNVLNAWHRYYDSLHLKNQVNEEETWRLLRVELLTQMAVSLGYSEIRQIDMMQHYYPEGHGKQLEDDWDLRESAKAFLKNGDIVYKIMIENWNNGKRMDGTEEPRN